jgi:hypothetical protein
MREASFAPRQAAAITAAHSMRISPKPGMSNNEPDAPELWMEAPDVRVDRSPTSADTMRIKEFLTRNAQPFRYQDVETEPGVEALLEGFHI